MVDSATISPWARGKQSHPEVLKAVGFGLLQVSLDVRTAGRSSCSVAAVLLKGKGGKSVPLMGIATDPLEGFIYVQSTPADLMWGEASWAVRQDAAGDVQLTITKTRATLDLLFSVPRGFTPEAIQLCSFGTAVVHTPPRDVPV